MFMASEAVFDSRQVALYICACALVPDMGSLVLEVLSGPMMVPVGRAQIEHIGSLAPNRPING